MTMIIINWPISVVTVGKKMTMDSWSLRFYLHFNYMFLSKKCVVVVINKYINVIL